jgi:hypothetical protein
LLAFARDSDLIASGADDVDAAFIFFFERAPKSVGALVLDELSEVLDLFVGRVLRDAKIKLDGFAAAAPPVPMAVPE